MVTHSIHGASPSDRDLASLFKSNVLCNDYLLLYDTLLSEWPCPPDKLEIETIYGITHVNAIGSPEASPLFLLPGFGSNSTMWFANIQSLSQHFRVFAVDTPGQPGRSIPDLPLTAETTSDWLQLLMEGLNIRSPNIAGVSLGGWITLDFAIRHPEAVNKIGLLDPAASLAPMSVTFLLHSLLPMMIHPTRRSLLRYFRWLTRGNSSNANWGELMVQGILGRQPSRPLRPRPFTDAELRSCSVPTLLFIGEASAVYDPRRALDRARMLMPNVEAQLLEGASHGLNYERADVVNTSLIRFFKDPVDRHLESSERRP